MHSLIRPLARTCSKLYVTAHDLKNSFNRSTTLFFIALMLSLFPGQSFGDISDEPYFLRLLLSLDRETNYSDTAGLQASVANPRGSSNNPASGDWGIHTQSATTGSLTNTNFYSESGAWFTATALTWNVNTSRHGSFTLAYARTDFRESDSFLNLEHPLDSNEYWVGYSRKLDANKSLGVEIRYVDANIVSEFLEPTLGGTPLRSETQASRIDVEIGFLAQINSSWFVGIVGVIGVTDAPTDINTTIPLLLGGDIKPAGFTLDEVSEEINTRGLRTGLTYLASDRMEINIDAQYFEAKSDFAGSASIAKIAVGTELQSDDATTYRLGIGVDSESEITYSAGIGFVLTDRLHFDLAYQYNAAPELEIEFGTFQGVFASLLLKF